MIEGRIRVLQSFRKNMPTFLKNASAFEVKRRRILL